MPSKYYGQSLYYTTFYSVDDGGHYAEVYNAQGETIYETELYPLESGAREDARLFIRRAGANARRIRAPH